VWKVERNFGLLIERGVKWEVDEEIGPKSIFALVFRIAEREVALVL